MINKKLAGLLLVPLIGATMGMANAATPSASQTLSVTLGSLVNITTDGGVTTASMDVDTGNLSTALTSKFKIQTNQAQTLYVNATTASSTTPNTVAFFKQGANIYVVLSNIGATQKPTDAAITDCKAATPNPDNNSNAIAYNVTGVTLTGATTTTPTYDATKNQYVISANPGQTSATTTIATTALPTTYSYMDTAGTYQAVVTLSNVSL